MGCAARVWDNGDTDSCGKPTLPGHTYCLGHRPEMLSNARKHAEDAERVASELRRIYEKLLAEGQA